MGLCSPLKRAGGENALYLGNNTLFGFEQRFKLALAKEDSVKVLASELRIKSEVLRLLSLGAFRGLSRLAWSATFSIFFWNIGSYLRAPWNYRQNVVYVWICAFFLVVVSMLFSSDSRSSQSLRPKEDSVSFFLFYGHAVRLAGS